MDWFKVCTWVCLLAGWVEVVRLVWFGRLCVRRRFLRWVKLNFQPSQKVTHQNDHRWKKSKSLFVWLLCSFSYIHYPCGRFLFLFVSKAEEEEAIVSSQRRTSFLSFHRPNSNHPITPNDGNTQSIQRAYTDIFTYNETHSTLFLLFSSPPYLVLSIAMSSAKSQSANYGAILLRNQLKGKRIHPTNCHTGNAWYHPSSASQLILALVSPFLFVLIRADKESGRWFQRRIKGWWQHLRLAGENTQPTHQHKLIGKGRDEIDKIVVISGAQMEVIYCPSAPLHPSPAIRSVFNHILTSSPIDLISLISVTVYDGGSSRNRLVSKQLSEWYMMSNPVNLPSLSMITIVLSLCRPHTCLLAILLSLLLSLARADTSHAFSNFRKSIQTSHLLWHLPPKDFGIQMLVQQQTPIRVNQLNQLHIDDAILYKSNLG